MEELLLAAAKSGILYVLILLVLCFVAVHAVHLAVLGWQTLRPSQHDGEPKKEDPPPKEAPPEKSEKDAEKPQAVYYLVEKKRVKKKPKYSEPKRVEVKED